MKKTKEDINPTYYGGFIGVRPKDIKILILGSNLSLDK